MTAKPSRRGSDDDLLVLSEARLRRAQRVARLGSWELDLATERIWASDMAFQIYGLSVTPDNSLPYDIAKQIPLPEHRSALDQALRDLMRMGIPYEIRFRICRPSDGAVRHLHSFAEATCDASGKPVLITGTMQDVTEHEEANRALQAALRANEERAKLILEQAADAIFLALKDGGFSEVNAQACELTGYDRAELLGKSFTLIFDPAVLEAVPLRFDLLERQAVVRERLLTRKDGSQVLVEMRSKKLSDATYQSIVRDISERRRLEEQLYLRQRMDSVGAMAGGIAHDFNNILGAIVGYADALRLSETPMDPEHESDVGSILQCCQRGADLIRGLKMITNPDPYEIESFDLYTVAAEAFRVLSETTDRRIRKEMLIPEGRFFVAGNSSSVYHGLMNLGINAVQAIEQKGPEQGDFVRIAARDHAALQEDLLPLSPGSYVHVEVQDTGVGMSPEVQMRAFDLLFTTKEKSERKGQGLGLAVVFNVFVRQHHGLVDVESREGEGSTFHLYLPSGNRVPKATVVSEPSIRGGDEVILIIDDERAILGLQRRILEKVGYTVLTAADGQEGVEIFRKRMEDIDLVLLDRTLPRLAGEQVLREVQSLRPDVKVIISSGDSGIGLSAFPGAVRILSKPTRLSLLYEAVREVLDQ